MSLDIRPASLEEMYVEWDMEGDLFSVFRSTSPNDSFEKIAETDQRFYVDATANMYDQNIRYYYRVEGYKTDGTKVAEDGPVTLEYNMRDHVAHKIIYEMNVLLRVMNNPPVYFLLRKREGMRCPDCWNPITNRVRYANCKTCNGTGFIQGYHPPIVSRISQDVSQYQLASGEMDDDKVSLSPIRAWVPNQPLLYPEDVMVDVMNQRFKVINVARRTKSQYVIRQVLDLAPIERGHPAYNLDIDRTVISP